MAESLSNPGRPLFIRQLLDGSPMETPDLREQQLDAWLALTGQDPGRQGSVRLPVLSGSMLPAIPLGALLEIELANDPVCRVGDVVVFQAGPERLTAHRVLAGLKLGSRHWILQKGDSNALGHWISRSRVCGLVVRVLPGDGMGAEIPPDDAKPAGTYSLSAARASRRQHFRNLALMWPRLLRDFLFPRPGPRPEEQNDSTRKQ